MNRQDICSLELDITCYSFSETTWCRLKLKHPELKSFVFTLGFPQNDLAHNIIVALAMIEKDLVKIRGLKQ